MENIAKLLDRAKAVHRLPSDYKLALVMGISHSALINYRTGKTLPDSRVISLLCDLTGDDREILAVEIEAKRAKTDEARAIWNSIAARLRGGASAAILSVLFATVLIAGYAGEARASASQALHSACVKSLYIVSNTFLSVGHFVQVRLRQITGLFRLFSAPGFW